MARHPATVSALTSSATARGLADDPASLACLGVLHGKKFHVPDLLPRVGERVPRRVVWGRHQIDSDIVPTEAGYFHPLRPVRPPVHFRNLVLRVLQKHPPDQVLEPPALFRFVTAVPADALQDLADGRLAFAEPEGE